MTKTALITGVTGQDGAYLAEVGLDAATGKVLIEIDPTYYRPTEVEILMGDPTKAKEKLGWEAKVGFEEPVKIMIKEDRISQF